MGAHCRGGQHTRGRVCLRAQTPIARHAILTAAVGRMLRRSRRQALAPAPSLHPPPPHPPAPPAAAPAAERAAAGLGLHECDRSAHSPHATAPAGLPLNTAPGCPAGRLQSLQAEARQAGGIEGDSARQATGAQQEPAAQHTVMIYLVATAAVVQLQDGYHPPAMLS